jgi:hypothetical protein
MGVATVVAGKASSCRFSVGREDFKIIRLLRRVHQLFDPPLFLQFRGLCGVFIGSGRAIGKMSELLHEGRSVRKDILPSQSG